MPLAKTRYTSVPRVKKSFLYLNTLFINKWKGFAEAHTPGCAALNACRKNHALSRWDVIATNRLAATQLRREYW